MTANNGGKKPNPNDLAKKTTAKKSTPSAKITKAPAEPKVPVAPLLEAETISTEAYVRAREAEFEADTKKAVEAGDFGTVVALFSEHGNWIARHPEHDQYLDIPKGN